MMYYDYLPENIRILGITQMIEDEITINTFETMLAEELGLHQLSQEEPGSSCLPWRTFPGAEKL